MDSPLSVLIISEKSPAATITEKIRELNTDCTIDTAESGKTALIFLENNIYDLIIIQYPTRDLSGAKLLEALREEKIDIPVIVIVGKADEGSLPAALYRGPECTVLPASEQAYTNERIQHKIAAVLDKKRREEAFETHRIQSSGIITHIPDPTFAIDREGRVIAWNKAIEDLTGVPAADILGKGDYEYSIPFYGHRVPTLINFLEISEEELGSLGYHVLQRTKNAISIESTLIEIKGKKYYVRANASLIYDRSGNITGAIESITDITALKDVENALRESKDKFRGITERISDLILSTDTDGMITYASPSAETILGYEPEFMYGKGPEEFLLPNDLEVVHTAIGKLKQGAEVKGLEISFRKKDGRYAILEMSGSPVMESGVVSGMQVIGRDVTGKKLAEERIFRLLREQKELLGIINKSPAVVFLWKAEENWPVERVTENVSLFGYTVDDFVSGRVIFSSIIHPDDLEQVGAEVKYYSAHQTDNFVQKYRIYGKDRKIHWIEDFTHIRRSKTGSITHYQGIIIDITERKLAEEALQLSRSRYRQLFESSPISLWEEDFSAGKKGLDRLKEAGVTDFRAYFEEHPEEVVRFAGMAEILDVNNATLHLLKAENKDELTAGLGNIFTDESLKTFREELITLAEGGLRYTGEGGHKTLSGDEISVILQMVVAPGYEQSLGRVLISLLDITDRKRAEEALAREKANIEYILDSLPGMFYMFYLFDSTGRFIRWNKNLETLTGYSGEEISRMKPLEFIDEKYQDTVTEGIRKAFSEGYADIEAGIVTKDGRKIPFLFSASSKIIGDSSYILGMGLDISRTKEAEQEILKLALIVQHSKEFIALADIDGVITFINRAGAEMIGIRAADIGGYPVKSIVSGEERDRLQSEIFPALRETGSWEGDLRYRNAKTGSLVDVHAMTFTIKDPDTGAPLYLANVSLDITDRKKAETALKEVNKKLNLLGSITRHDILNQLTVAQGYMEMLEMDAFFPPGSQEEEYARIVSGAIETIERQILFTRDYQDLGEQAPEWYHVGRIIEQNYRNLGFREVSLVNDVGDLEIFADPLFTKVIYNLFDNAVKHGETITTITFSSARSDDQVDLICEDDGVGIPDDVKEKIFRREFYKHSGLGLFLSREILSITGLSIEETGEAGKGARFVIHIPKGLFRFGE
ncbi:PAS domain S-box protein [Methanogenium sp. S4BF]|uniref:PAS domain S-box protein n=1 Tax=Methanogenium sp. S4BF TaxID=1789226 RepID=UPI002416CA7B|nr:PAS domain S-box protein [Methanogenium sp. S4BF]WFN33427.1 PAS domain S-box protein [Methanogenium sp. S4BF]